MDIHGFFFVFLKFGFHLIINNTRELFVWFYKINVIYAILLHITKYESVLKTIFYMSFLFLHVQLC